MQIEPNSRSLRSARALAEANWALCGSFAHLASGPKAPRPSGEIGRAWLSQDDSHPFLPLLASPLVDSASANASVVRAAALIRSEPDALTVHQRDVFSDGI